jgi:hypothetical protein
MDKWIATKALKPIEKIFQKLNIIKLFLKENRELIELKEFEKYNKR